MPVTSVTPLEIDHLTFCYWRRAEEALRGVSLNLERGQVMLVAGSSGCGKTTLMRCINGLIPRTCKGDLVGDLRLFGRSLREMGMEEISQTLGTKRVEG